MFGYPDLLEDEHTIDWLNQKLEGNFIHYFHCMLKQEKIIPRLSIPSSCPIYIDCMRLLQRYKEGQSAGKEDVLFKDDCNSFLSKYYKKVKKDERGCSCGRPFSKHMVLIHLITFLIQQEKSFNYKELFTPLYQLSKTTSLQEVYQVIDDTVENVSLFIFYLSTLDLSPSIQSSIYESLSNPMSSAFSIFLISFLFSRLSTERHFLSFLFYKYQT